MTEKPEEPTRLVFERVSRRFGAHAAVHEVSLAVRAGEVLCLLGPSGCGKTTLLRIAAGIERQDAGRVLIDLLAVDGNASAAGSPVGHPRQYWIAREGHTFSTEVANADEFTAEVQRFARSRVEAVRGRLAVLPGWEHDGEATIHPDSSEVPYPYHPEA